MSNQLDPQAEHAFLKALAALCNEHQVKIVVKHCCCGDVTFRHSEPGEQITADSAITET